MMPVCAMSIHLNIGIREIKVAGEKLLLNGKPVFLRGFGKHEDTGLFGRALNVPSIIRDFELLKWLGANSFRTSHYPYSDEAMQLADQYGFLVIDETPAVSPVFMDGPEIQQARTQQLKLDIVELVERDKNHPCVIMWSVANEPLTKPFHTTNPEPPESVARGTEFFGPMFDLFRQLDNTRPVTMVSLQGGPTDWQAFGDVICTNSYNGWYAISGRIDDAAKAVEEEALKLRARHPGKPIMFTEFGADAIAGTHAQPPVIVEREVSGGHRRDVYPHAGEAAVHHRHPSVGVRRFPHFAKYPSYGGHEFQGCVHPRAPAQNDGAPAAGAMDPEVLIGPRRAQGMS